MLILGENYYNFDVSRYIKQVNPNCKVVVYFWNKLVFDSYSNKQAAKNTNLEDAREGLKALGFKVAEIDNVLSKIGNEPRSSEEYLREALKLLRK